MAYIGSDFFDFTPFLDSELSSPLPSSPSTSLPPTVSHLLNLPVELLELVVANLSPLDLFSLIQANTSLNFWLLQSALKMRIDKNRTLLHHVALNGSASVIRYLLSKVVCIPLIAAEDDTGSTPLHLAAGHSPGIVKVLLEHGAKINLENHSRETPLFCAVEAGRADIVHILTSNGANVNAREEKGLTVLEKAVMYGKEDVIRALKEEEGLGYKALTTATASGFVEAVEKMIKEGVNPFEHRRYTALKVIACWRNGGLVTEMEEGGGMESEGISPKRLVKRKRKRETWEQLEEEVNSPEKRCKWKDNHNG